ncbi:MAG: hypothetical protein A3J79_07325 [Elusimicrobia bacterium RIFOXYB2_FULL_62_6]|nr:MAG: hypothetical protein A3J79_07325 [Elusimicrobia bacterium RIFOXYB2_FULL_62_6]
MLRHAYRLPSVRWLVACNLAAMLSVFFFGGLPELSAVYWWEMVIIWLFSFIRVAVVSPLYTLAMSVLLLIGAAFFMAVFTIGLAFAGKWPEFWIKGHLGLTILTRSVLLSAIPLLFSHAYSFYRNFWPDREKYRGPNEDASLRKFVRYPYQRAALWSVVMIISLVAAGSLRKPWLAYVFIGLFKILADVWSHITLNDLTQAAKQESGR